MSVSARVEPVPYPVAGLPRRAARLLGESLPWARLPVRIGLAVLSVPGVLQGALAAALLACFVLGLRAAEAHLSGMPDFQVDPGFMKVREMPPWLDPDWAESIDNPFEGRRTVNLFEPGLAGKAHAAFRGSPWIETVCHVRKEFPDRLQVRIRVRTPLAAVPFGGTHLLVDGHGVLLPREFDRVPDFGFPLRVLEGIESVPPEAGRPWTSERLDAGLRVAAVLLTDGRKVFERIRRIDVSLLKPGRPGGRTEVLLYAAEGGGAIEFGSAPGRRKSLEIPLEKKLDNLDRLLTACPDMRSVKYALVQFDNPVYAPKD